MFGTLTNSVFLARSAPTHVELVGVALSVDRHSRLVRTNIVTTLLNPTMGLRNNDRISHDG